MRERSNWRLSPQQQAWLREQRWHILITELDEVEDATGSSPIGWDAAAAYRNCATTR